MDTKRVAAIVVTCNRKALLLRCLDALRRQTLRSRLTIVVIDNAGTDGTQEALAPLAAAQELVYVRMKENLGGAGGFQYGLRYAAEHGFAAAWVMDDDALPQPEALEALLQADEALGGTYGFLSSRVLWKDGSICRMNIPRQSLWHRVQDFSSPRVPVIMASFVSLFVPVPVIRRFGLPLRDFFIWTDDWEWTRRISRALPCYLVNGSVVVHHSARNEGASLEWEAEDRLWRYDYLYRNDVVLYRREGLAGALYEAVRLPWHAVRVLLRARGNRLLRLKKIWRGTWRGLRFHPAIEYPGQPERQAAGKASQGR